MPIVDKNILKKWFEDNTKPPQEYFWNWIDSFWHKDEKIPQNAVENLTTELSNKAEINHGHGDAYAEIDAGNLDSEYVEAWKETLGINDGAKDDESNTFLTKKYDYFDLTEKDTEASFNTIVEANIKNLQDAVFNIRNKNKVTIDGKLYEFVKHPNNTAEDLEINDFVLNLWKDLELCLIAQYKTGNGSSSNDYIAIGDSIDFNN